jgi:hypothetical protein
MMMMMIKARFMEASPSVAGMRGDGATRMPLRHGYRMAPREPRLRGA